jgi:hypothetical protein
MSEVLPTHRWRVLLAPRWLGWHLFAVVAVVGMIWLGDWQFRRAQSGNMLSWAYTFEWPIFAIFGVVFWIKTVRDELKPSESPGEMAEVQLPAGIGSAARSGSAAGSAPGAAGHAFASSGSDDPDIDDDPVAESEYAEYNAYLARLGREVRGHGKWHGFR